MNESDFNQLAEDTMTEIEEAIDDCGVDIDYDSAGGILTLEFSNGSQIMVNKQTPLSQLWVAASPAAHTTVQTVPTDRPPTHTWWPTR